MNSDEIKRRLLSNAEEISRLHERIHETLRYRSDGAKKRGEWERACQEFHSRYDQLAFPGGYSSAFERILAGDNKAIEAALCFLECRPYFFRSGYMWKEILRKIKRAPLSELQVDRLNTIVKKHNEWRASKNAA